MTIGAKAVDGSLGYSRPSSVVDVRHERRKCRRELKSGPIVRQTRRLHRIMEKATKYYKKGIHKDLSLEERSIKYIRCASKRRLRT